MLEIIDRNEAMQKGLRFFYTGRPCPRGHDSERYTSNGGCLLCVREAVAARRRKEAQEAATAHAAGDTVFRYQIAREDYPALLAFAQGLDLQRGRSPLLRGGTRGDGA